MAKATTAAELVEHTLPAATRPTCYVCGPTGFVESVLERLIELGHEPDRLRAERYGERSTP